MIDSMNILINLALHDDIWRTPSERCHTPNLGAIASTQCKSYGKSLYIFPCWSICFISAIVNIFNTFNLFYFLCMANFTCSGIVKIIYNSLINLHSVLILSITLVQLLSITLVQFTCSQIYLIYIIYKVCNIKKYWKM